MGLSSLFILCTSNPVGDSETSAPNREIRGRVSLSNNDDPQNVYIWFDALNMAQTPDLFGNFQFTLPPSESQTSSGGLDGNFTVNFFIANFNFVSKNVVIKNGSILYGSGDIDANGKFFPDIFLNEQLRIRTEPEPDSVTSEKDSLSFSVEVNLHTFKDTVDVFFPRMVGELSAPLLMRNTQTEEISIIPAAITSEDTTDFKRITTRLVTRKMEVKLATSDISTGVYEVIPYLLVINEEVPGELIQSLGANAEELSPNYVKLPFIRRGGRLEIVEDPTRP